MGVQDAVCISSSNLSLIPEPVIFVAVFNGLGGEAGSKPLCNMVSKLRTLKLLAWVKDRTAVRGTCFACWPPDTSTTDEKDLAVSEMWETGCHKHGSSVLSGELLASPFF